MRRNIIIILMISVIIPLLFSCSAMKNKNEENNKNAKQKIYFDEIYSFIDDIINNYQNIDSVIFKSHYYDKNYSIIKFMRERFSDYFNGLSKNGYEIDEIDFFNVNNMERFRRGDATERYPEYESKEINEITHIFNGYVIKKGMIRNDNNNNGAVIFTFGLRKDGVWYLRLVDFEYVIL